MVMGNENQEGAIAQTGGEFPYIIHSICVFLFCQRPKWDRVANDGHFRDPDHRALGTKETTPARPLDTVFQIDWPSIYLVLSERPERTDIA